MRAHLGAVVWAAGLGLVSFASIGRGGEPAGRFDDLAVLKAEVAMLQATVKRQAAEIEKLKAENRPLQEEIATLRRNLADVREENERLRGQIKTFKGASGKDGGGARGVIPRVGDETSAARIATDPRKYLDKVVILCGGVSLGRGGYYGYRGAEKTHVSFHCTDVGDDWHPAGRSVGLYLRREKAEPLIAALDESIKKGSNYKLMRVRAIMLTSRLDPDADSNSTPELEFLDWQFLEPGGITWGPWALRTTDKEAPKGKTAPLPRR